MPRAPRVDQPRPSRPAAAAGSGNSRAAHAAQPDAELIRLCAEMVALERRIDAMFAGPMTDASLEAAEAAACIIEVDQRRVLDRICTMTPVTMEGWLALARSVALISPDFADDDPEKNPDVRLASTLLRGLLTRT